MTVNEFYGTVGGDYADVASRLQNDALIAKFLRMLPRDNSMAALTDAIRTADVKKAFCAVHTLKGIALNLSLAELAKVCADMTELLRGCSEMPPETQQFYIAVNEKYTQVSEALESLEG